MYMSGKRGGEDKTSVSHRSTMKEEDKQTSCNVALPLSSKISQVIFVRRLLSMMLILNPSSFPSSAACHSQCVHAWYLRAQASVVAPGGKGREYSQFPLISESLL
jgi:hypothetical protein